MDWNNLLVSYLNHPVHSWVEVSAVLSLTSSSRTTMQHHDRGASGVARDLPVDGVQLRHLKHPGGVRLGGWIEHVPQ